MLPHNFIIIEKPNFKKIPGIATWNEHFGALFAMTHNKHVPSFWKKYIYSHMEELCAMSENWAWETCRRWSDKVFLMIRDGRLSAGWTDNYAIKDIQRDICLVGSRAKTIVTENKKQDFKERVSYEKEIEGVPCATWNEGKDCNFSFTHGEGSNKLCHLCSWCISKFKRSNSHRECDCLNKRRWTMPRNSQPNEKVF